MKTKLRPFSGLHYNLKQISDLSAVVTPPYDVINSEMQEEFYNRSPYNFVRVDLTKEEGAKRYEVAEQVFKKWQEEKVLVKDEKPAFYFHHQTFKLPDGKKITRKGFFGTRKIEDFSEGGIKPHEKTLDGPKQDRLLLTRATKTNLSPVFSLYSDPDFVIDRAAEATKSQKPWISFQTKEGELHEIWPVIDEKACAQIAAYLENQPLFIADGHHRYETALNYRNERRKENPNFTGEEGFNFILMYFSNMDDQGLIILPIHRALHGIAGLTADSLVEKLKGTFEIQTLPALDNAALVEKLKTEGKGAHAIALISRDAQKSYLFKVSHDQWKKHPLYKTLHPSLANLDVTVLHRLVFEEILKITQEAQAKQTNLIYWKDTQRAINETRSGKCDLTFLLNPTKVTDMQLVANGGEKMPQKSTYFYPKILSGLVLHSL